MRAGVVERLYGDFSQLRGFLQDGQDGSGMALLPVVEENFPKVLLLAAASHFEKRLTEIVKDFIKEVTTDDHPIVSLVEAKAIERQYHTWFAWKEGSANSFFRLFGAGFKQYAQDQVNREDGLQDSIRDFLEIGRERNQLVHEDFVNFRMNKTSEDVYELYRSATLFVEWFPQAIREFSPADGQPAA